MTAPARIKQEAAAADEALQRMLSGKPAEAEPVANPDAPPAAANPDVPPAPAPAPAAPTAPTVQPTTADSELQRLQQTLHTEQGRVAAQNAELAELRGRVQQLSELVSKPQPAAPATPAPTPAALITDEDRKDFGEDMIDFVQRMFRQMMGSTLDGIIQRLVACEQQLRRTTDTVQTVARSAEEQAFDRYVAALTRLCPTWQAVNEDAQFLDWLKKPAKFSRKARAALLADAHAQADAETVAEFFNEFLAESGKAAPAAPTPTPAAPAVDPATLVAPTPAASPTPAANPRGGRVWTQKEIEAKYDDRLKGRISQADFVAVEAEIFQAIAEGRVRG